MKLNKEIILPWTCETQEKASKIIKLVLFPLIGSLLLYYGIELKSPIFMVGLFMILGSIFFWGLQFIGWSYEDKLPSFRCKCEVDKS